MSKLKIHKETLQSLSSESASEIAGGKYGTRVCESNALTMCVDMSCKCRDSFQISICDCIPSVNLGVCLSINKPCND